MPKFVVLRHDVGPKSKRGASQISAVHFDWMFQCGESLRTWATDPLDSILHEIEIDANALANHRLAYLEHEGDIGGDRGSVTAVLRGEYTLTEQDANCFCVIMTWQDNHIVHQRRLSLHRSADVDSSEESRFLWRLRLGR